MSQKGTKIKFTPRGTKTPHVFDSKTELFAYLLLELSPMIDDVEHHPDGSFGADFIATVGDHQLQFEATSLNNDGLTVGGREDESPEQYFSRKMEQSKLPIVLLFGDISHVIDRKKTDVWEMHQHGGQLSTIPFYAWFYDVDSDDIIKKCVAQALDIKQKTAKRAAYFVRSQAYKRSKTWYSAIGEL